MFQNVVIVGNLGSDVEMRYTPAGVAVASFSVAVNKRWTGADGQQQEKVTWFRVSAWRKLAEVCNEYLAKGRLVLVEGEIDASAYMPRDGGDPRASLDLTARTVKFLGGKSDNAPPKQERGSGDPFGAPDDGDVPF